MDWYQTTVRVAAAGLSWNALIAPNMGQKLDVKMARMHLKRLNEHLQTLEHYWLREGTFVCGRRSALPSPADLLIYDDIVNLAILRASPFVDELGTLDSILGSFPTVSKWMDAVRKSCSPRVWSEVHAVLGKVAQKQNKASRM